MLAVVGTLPEEDFPLIMGTVELKGRELLLEGRQIPVTRGTAALLGAAGAALKILDKPPPLAFLVGDTGLGRGSQRLYEYVAQELGTHRLRVLAFHYILPQVDWHAQVYFALERLNPRPFLIADAGFMYVAKMSGLAPAYDLFTPDVGELAFLADEEAPHPFYTRGFILTQDDRVPELISRAYVHGNAARYLLVKGQTDYVADRQGIVATISEPQVEALEAVGGTGDTLTGMVAALINAGWEIVPAAVLAARANRLAGKLSGASPATSVAEIVEHIPLALKELLEGFRPDLEAG